LIDDLRKEIEELKQKLAVNDLDIGKVEEPEVVITISPEQQFINELKKQQEWIKDLQKDVKQRKKKKKQDPKTFELFLDDLQNLCN